MGSSVYADVTLTSGAPSTEVSAVFLMQDKFLWVLLMMRNLCEAQTAAIRAVPGMERAHIPSPKDARGELQAYVTANPQRWQEVKGDMANALPLKPTSSGNSYERQRGRTPSSSSPGRGTIRPPSA